MNNSSEIKADTQKVSILIPVYNAERYLRKCLDSVKSQTYKNLEIILVDDGSKDNSPKICDEYAQKDSRFICVHQKNAGPGVARNTGLDRVSGDYLVYIDSDDYVCLDYVETMLKLMNEYNADVVEIGFVWMLAKEDVVPNYDKSVLVFESSKELINDYFAVKRKLQNNVCGHMYRWSKISDVRFSDKSIAEDSEYSLTALSKCDKLVKYSRGMYCYRAYHDSVTRGAMTAKHFQLPEVCLRDMEYAEVLGAEVESWEHTIRTFENSIMNLLKRMAQEKRDNDFDNEIEKLKELFKKVETVAQRHDVKMNYDVLNALSDVKKWCADYRKNNVKAILIIRARDIAHRLLAKYRTAINYEYDMDNQN